MKIIKWFKTLFRIVRSHDDELSAFTSKVEAINYSLNAVWKRVGELDRKIDQHTVTGVDVGFGPKDRSWVVVVGRFKGSDYVQTYDLGHADFEHLVRQIQAMRKSGAATYVDSPPQMRAVFEREW